MRGPHSPLRRRYACIAAAACIGTAILPVVPAPAQSGPASQLYPVVMQSPAGYHEGIPPGNGPELVWQDMVRHENAGFIAVHFSSFDLAPGDKAVIHDGNGGQRYEMTGRGRGGAGTFWARHVKGDTLVVELYSSGDPSGNGYTIDTYAAGYTEPPPPPSICGIDDKSNAVCFASSFTNEYAHARPVARLLINATTWCTGFLVSTNNHLITNQHCIDDAGDALNTDIEFLAEAPGCASNNFPGAYPGDVYDGAELVMVKPGMDFAIVRITNGNPYAAYGRLLLEDRLPPVGESIYIPQHPAGRAREIALYSSNTNDAGGFAAVQVIDAASCSPSTVMEIGYYADTEGGSSGSPVISRASHRVIGLHHCGVSFNCDTEFNNAVPANLIKAEIAPLIEEVSITPRSSVTFSGPVGGPFFPGCYSFSLSNNTPVSRSWTSATNAPWLEVIPAAGTVAAGQTGVVQVCINSLAGALANGTYTGRVTFTLTGSGESFDRDIVLQTGGPDGMTEQFINDFDLDNTMLTFTPIEAEPYYSICISNGVTAFPTDPSGSAALGLGDDESAYISFGGGQQVRLFGHTYTGLYVNSNGNLTFTNADVTFSPTLNAHFGHERVSLLFVDLSPNLSGTILWTQLADRVAVTFDEVREFGTSNQNSMQAELFTNGVIRLTWLSMNTASGIAGLSDGGGVPENFLNSDISGYLLCAPPGNDSDNDGIDDGWETANGLIVGINDAMDDDDSDGWLNIEEYIADTVPSNSASFFHGITGMTENAGLDLAVFPTSTGRLYDLELSTGLFQQTWVPYSTAVPGSGGTLILSVSNAPANLNIRTRIALP